MTYYYDSEARVLLAVDPETEDVRILEPIDFEEDEPALKTVKVKPVPQSAKDYRAWLPRVRKSRQA
jgi:hypothetical protein